MPTLIDASVLIPAERGRLDWDRVVAACASSWAIARFTMAVGPPRPRPLGGDERLDAEIDDTIDQLRVALKRTTVRPALPAQDLDEIPAALAARERLEKQPRRRLLGGLPGPHECARAQSRRPTPG